MMLLIHLWQTWTKLDFYQEVPSEQQSNTMPWRGCLVGRALVWPKLTRKMFVVNRGGISKPARCCQVMTSPVTRKESTGFVIKALQRVRMQSSSLRAAEDRKSPSSQTRTWFGRLRTRLASQESNSNTLRRVADFHLAKQLPGAEARMVWASQYEFGTSR